MKFFVKILIPSLFLSLSASAHDTVNDEPFIRCFKKKEPNVDVVAFYAYAEGIAGMVVKGEKYVIDERLKNRGYPLA